MTDFQILSINLTVLSIVVTLLLVIIEKSAKK